MNVLFWNTGDNNDIDIIEQIIIENDCDIASFAELEVDANILIASLHGKGFKYYHIPSPGCERLTILSKYELADVENYAESYYYTFKVFPHPHLKSILIAFVHFPSKLHADLYDHLGEASDLKEAIEEMESIVNCENTIILGDFNMNPFDPGMISARGMHALPIKTQAKKGDRIIRGKKYKMFYNPMWKFFTEEHGPGGTFYYSKATSLLFHWNILDQIILRPKLIPIFNISELKLISFIGSKNLITKSGIIDKKISDHLPVFFVI